MTDPTPNEATKPQVAIPDDLQDRYKAILRTWDHVPRYTSPDEEFMKKLIERIAALRAILIAVGRNLGAGLADCVSDEFLAHLPEEAKLKCAQQAAELAEAQAENAGWVRQWNAAQDGFNTAVDKLDAMQAELDTLTSEIAEANSDWDRLYEEYKARDAAQSAELEQLRAERDEFGRKGKELCQAYGTSLIIIHDLKTENARLKAPVSNREWADALTLAPSIYITDAERATQIIKDRIPAVVSSTYGDMVKAHPDVSLTIEPHIWDNKTPSEQRDWALAQLDSQYDAGLEAAAKLCESAGAASLAVFETNCTAEAIACQWRADEIRNIKRTPLDVRLENKYPKNVPKIQSAR